MNDNKYAPILDLRMRLKVDIEEGNTMRKVYKGSGLNDYEMKEIKDYHVINDVVVDRGPSPYSIQIEI